MPEGSEKSNNSIQFFCFFLSLNKVTNFSRNVKIKAIIKQRERRQVRKF